MSENNHHVTSAELQTELKALENRLMEREGQLEERLKAHTEEQLERLETKLLTAFHGWARSMEI